MRKVVLRDSVGRAQVTGPDQFKKIVVRALRRLQRRTTVLLGFFRDKNLAYIEDATAAASSTNQRSP